MESEVILFVNFFMYLLLFIFLYKNRGFDASVFILMLWLTSSFFSIIYFNSNIYVLTKKTLNVIPQLYLFICFFISFIPFLNLRTNNLVKIYVSPNIIKPFIYICGICSFIPFIENLFHIFFSGNSLVDLSDNYEIRSNSDFDSRAHMSFIGSKLNSITLYFCHLSPIFLFYFSSRVRSWDLKNIILVLGLLFASFNPALFMFNLGSRTNTIQDLLYLGFIFFLFRNQLNSKIKTITLSIISVLIFVLLSGTVFITIGRFGETDFTIFDWISRYAGESFVNFNGDMWHVSNYANGENSFSIFTTGEERNIYSLDQRMGIRMYVFYTFIGDLFADFGSLTTLILLVVVSAFLYRKFNGKYLAFWKVILICLYSRILLTGFLFLTILNSTRYFLFTLIICLFFWLYERFGSKSVRL